MYCKTCGHRTEAKLDVCPKCGAHLVSAVVVGPVEKPRVRWHVLVLATALSAIAFIALPRLFLRTEFDPIGPTSKLRFLRALEHTEYRRIGQREFRVDGQTLILIWDLRWNSLPESKQRDILRIIGRAWTLAGGEDTRLRIEGEDAVVASYLNGEAHLESL